MTWLGADDEFRARRWSPDATTTHDPRRTTDMASPEELAIAFSSHRFSETYEHLSPSVRWVSVGSTTMVGKDAVVDACDQATTAMAELRLDRRRFLTITGDQGVAVDTVTAYVDPSGGESVVASCDIYEFEAGRIAVITSYAVEV
jgi:hypothetical protein